MRVIKPLVKEILEKDPFRKIEIVGRTCYKSNSVFDGESSRSFYRKMVSSNHTAMLEHACFVFLASKATYEAVERYYWERKEESPLDLHIQFTKDRERYLISGNLRALNEFGHEAILWALYRIDPDLVYVPHAWEARSWNIAPVDMGNLRDVTFNEAMHHIYRTLSFICDRGVTHEMVRHRPCSFAQESTRYCNYSLGKFNTEITVIDPLYLDPNTPGYRIWFQSCKNSEVAYLDLLDWGCTPQEARSVLPNSLKSELVVTSNLGEWEHIMDLRYIGTTGTPHPQMREVAKMAYCILNSAYPQYFEGTREIK